MTSTRCRNASRAYPMLVVEFFIGNAQAQTPSDNSLRLSAEGELSVLVLAVVGFLTLIKLYTRWPKAEAWLVGATLVVFVPAASFVLRIATNGRAAYHESLPALIVIAPLLGGIWWLVKTRSNILAGPDRVPMFKRQPPSTAASPESNAADDLPRKQVEPSAPAPTTPRVDTPRPTAACAPIKDWIFISYRRQDSADVTGRIYDRLVQRFGKDQIFKDVDSIPLGVDFREHLGSVVGRCNLLLAVMGEQWLGASDVGGVRRLDDAKDYVRIEIEAALSRKIPVIPVLVRGATVPSEGDLPASLASLSYRNGIAVRPDPDFHRDMDRLIAGLESHLNQ